MAKTVKHVDLKSYFGDEDHLLVSQKSSFARLIFEMLSEKSPTDSELKIFELILNLSIDHGAETPSALATIQASLDGKNLSESVAAGILQINEHHGGAIEPCMEILYSINKEQLQISNLVDEYLKEDKRMPGLGHRIYKEEDPRTKLIFEKMEEYNMDTEFLKFAKELEKEMESKKGKKLPLNIDAAIAVVLCTLGWNPKLSNAVFIVARVPGLCAHYINSM